MKFFKKIKGKHIFLLVSFFLVFVIYSQSIFGDFVYDDRGIVSHKPILENIENTGEILLLPYWSDEAGLYRPVTVFSYSLNFIIFGGGSMSFHIVNLLLYTLSVFFFFILLIKLFPKRKILAYLSALIFLVIPIHTEAVANIVGRAEILAFLFSMLSLIELLNPEKSQKIIEDRPLKIKEKTFLFFNRKYSSPWVAGFWFLLGLGSKETAIAVIPLSFFVLFYKNKEKINLTFLKKSIPHWLILFVSTFFYFVIRFLVLGTNFISNTATVVENPLKFVGLNERVATAFEMLTIYVKKSFFPFNLCSDYSYNQVPTHGFLNLNTIIGVFIFSFLIFSIIFFLKRRPPLSFASALFLFSYLPISNLITPIGTIGGERLMFFPVAGICIYFAYFLLKLLSFKPKKIFARIFVLLLLIIILSYSIISFNRAFDWMSEENLFKSAIKCAPESVLSFSNLGTVYYFNGELKKAEKIFKKSEQIYPEYSKGINNFGLVYWKQGKPQKAKEKYLQALSVENPYMGTYENLAHLLISQGKEEKAKRWLKILENVKISE